MFRIVFGLSILSIFGVCLFRTLFLFKAPPDPTPCKDQISHDRIKLSQPTLNRFLKALSIETVSFDKGKYNATSLLRLISHIENSYPAIHKAKFVTREIVSNYSLLYTIHGSDKTLSPYMLTSHMDVVPAVRSAWSSEPFEAKIKEDKNIYARGTIDSKHLLMSMLEALEQMIKVEKFQPRRTFYMIFGHDEEISGHEGAQTIAKILPDRLKANKWTQLEYILDEGNVVSKTRFPGIESDIALVGVVEKGYASMRICTVGSVGHGSMPPDQTAISKLAKAVSKFHANLLPSFLGLGVEREMIEIFAMHSKWPYKLVYSNFWLFQPLFEYIFRTDPTTNALIRTSTAVTMVTGGTKENVLPDSACALVNHRIHPLQKVADILSYDRSIIDDPTVSVEIHQSSEPTPVARYCDSCYGYQLIKRSIQEIYPGAVVVPSTFLAASDSRWYTHLSDSIYKFSAIAVQLDEMKRFHGHDERISLENYENLINFYHHLIANSDEAKLRFRPQERDEL